MARYAASTTVDSGASRAEIERTLRRYGADEFGYAWREGSAMIEFRVQARRVRFLIALPSPDDDEFKYTPARRQARTPAQRQEAYEQACRQRWRALALCIKAKLESVESGIEQMEEAFMPQLVLAGGHTVSELVTPVIDDVIARGSLTLALPGLDPLLLTG